MLRVRLLGELQAEADGEPIAMPPGRRGWALLAWLALHPGEHARGSVAARSSGRAPLAGVIPNRRTAAWKNRWLRPPPVSRTLRACRSVLVNPGWTTMLLAGTSAARKRRSSSSAKWTLAILDCP